MWLYIEFPIGKVLDPVGYAKIMDINIKNHIRLYPIQKDIRATIVPIEKTLYPQIMSTIGQSLIPGKCSGSRYKKLKGEKGKGL